MAETEEEKKKRWAKNRSMSYMTPAMAHAMKMSKYQSQNKYKEQFNKTKAKGYTAVSSTPQLEHAKTQSIRVSQNKYKSEFEKNKAKFTQVTDDPESLRLKRVTNQVSKVAYEGKGTALAERRKPRKREGKQETDKPKLTDDSESTSGSYRRSVDESKSRYGREAAEENTSRYHRSADDNQPSYDRPANEEESNHGSAAVESSYGRPAEDEATDEVTDNGGYSEEPANAGYNNGDYSGEDNNRFDADANQEKAASDDYTNANEYGDNDGAGYDYREGSANRYTEEDIVIQPSYDETSEETNNNAPEQAQDLEDDPELQEISETGLDDFYANLG